MNRRDFAAALAAAASFGASAQPLATRAGGNDQTKRPVVIAMLLYPGMTALDLVGPQVLLAGVADGGIHLVAAQRGPVASDTGLSIVATDDFASCPETVDVLFVPGGDGTPVQMRDAATLAFLRDRAARARWITSVCTGSLILGAAGLLRGYRATSHWCVRERVLPRLGAEPVDARVVFDRNRVTAAGVSAGLDLALALVARLSGEADAQTAQLVAEYAPEPPFRAGTPALAGSEITARAEKILAPLISGAIEATSGQP